MSKLIILGAGASLACPYTRPDLPLPLLADLPRILSPERVNPDATFYRWFGECLNRFLDAVENDLEVLLTVLYQLDEYFFVPEKQATLDDGIVDRILSLSALPEFFTTEADLRHAQQILELLQTIAGENKQASVTFSPRNFLALFEGCIRDYFQATILRQPCPLHLKLFEVVDHGDCVTTFNYDDIADYALLAAGKLNTLSFEYLGFESINLPEGSPTFGPRVQFLKMHGSLNWSCHHAEIPNPYGAHLPHIQGLRTCAAGGPAVHYYLGHMRPLPESGNTAGPILLPFLCKDLIYRTFPIFPMFARHLSAFRAALQSADEIYLVGKNFKNLGRELNGMIRYATCRRVRRLHVIDPSVDIEFHCALFNAELGVHHLTLEEYAAS